MVFLFSITIAFFRFGALLKLTAHNKLKLGSCKMSISQLERSLFDCCVQWVRWHSLMDQVKETVHTSQNIIATLIIKGLRG